MTEMHTVKQSNLLRILPLTLVVLLTSAPFALAQKPPSKVAEGSTVVEKDAAKWQQFSSKEGRFSILFPGLPVEETQSIGAPGVNFNLHLNRLHTFAEYSVMYADYPESINDNNVDLANSVLDNGLEGAVAEVNSKLLEVNKISLEGHPGRSYKERMADGGIMRGKTFLVGHRLFQIAITTPKEEGASADTVRLYETTAEKFLESFRLLAP